MISKEEIDRFRRYLKRNGTVDSYDSDWYSVKGLEIGIGIDCVYVYLTSDQWLVACTMAGLRLPENPYRVITPDFEGLMRLVEGGEMAYNNMENEYALEEL